MLKDEFQAAMKILQAFYGEKAFSAPEQLSIIAHAAMPLTRRDFEKVIAELALHFERKPFPADIARACYVRRNEIIQGIKRAVNAGYANGTMQICPTCQGAGLAPVWDRGSRNEYAFRCEACQAADERGLSQSIERWREDLAQRFLRASCPAAAHAQFRKEKAENAEQ